MFQHKENGLHFNVGNNIKKAAKWYFEHAAGNYVWSPKPMDPTRK